MVKWFVYLAQDNDVILEGITNDLVAEESLINYENNWSTNYKIVWCSDECANKIDALSKLKEISNLELSEKLLLIANSSKIIILKSDLEIDCEKFPLVSNLRYTLSIINFLKTLPELWKLDELYIENVAEYLKIKRSQVEFVKLWDISIDYSKNVGIITESKFFPIIKS